MTTLAISRLINVNVILPASPQQVEAFLTKLLVLGSSNVIDVIERLRTYSSLDQVAADFGTALPEYFAAQLWFSQVPRPVELKIGRWALNGTAGKLICAPLSDANKLIGAWNAVSNGGLTVSINGVPSVINNIDFGAASNLNGVASDLQGALAGVTVTYNAVYGRFEFQSNTTGVGSAISFLSAAGGTDISAMLAGTVGNAPAAYVADGIAAQTALATAALFDSEFGQTFYALTIPEASDDDHLAVAGYVEGASNKHIYGVSTQEAGCISSIVATDIASKLKALGYNRSVVQYSSDSAYSIASFLGRALTVDYGGQNTVITMMFKQEPGIVAEDLTAGQADALDSKNCNVLAAYQNDTVIVQQGKMASGVYLDEITGTDWLAVDITEAVYDLLYSSPTKIPQTDPGVHQISNTIEARCSQAVRNGLLAPGTWDAQGFGALETGGYLSKGFYVYASPVASQSASDRAARKAPAIQIAAKLAGAVQSSLITINVNR